MALAVSGANRVPTLPEVLTMAETGAKGYAAEFSLVMYAPRATPEAVVSCFRQAFVGGADDKPGPGGCRAWGRACADGAKAERCG